MTFWTRSRNSHNCKTFVNRNPKAKSKLFVCVCHFFRFYRMILPYWHFTCHFYVLLSHFFLIDLSCSMICSHFLKKHFLLWENLYGSLNNKKEKSKKRTSALSQLLQHWKKRKKSFSFKPSWFIRFESMLIFLRQIPSILFIWIKIRRFSI